jgi:hypothetical protein
VVEDLRRLVTGPTVAQVVVAVGVALGLFQLAHAVARGLVIAPIESGGFARGVASYPGSQPLTFTVDDRLFDYGPLLEYAVTLALFLLLAWLALRLVRRLER